VQLKSDADSLILPHVDKLNVRNGDVWRTVNTFLAWLERAGYESYDPYDIWGTAYGSFARQFYYRHSRIGVPLVAPILAAEILCPQSRVLWVKKQRFATADGQLVTAFVNLYRLNNDPRFLEKARALAAELLQYSVPGYSGYCWGYPFDWQHNRGFWKKDTPYITSTPYCYEAFVRLSEATGENSFSEIARSISKFVHDDLDDTPTGPDAAAGSYAPNDDSRVINASAYRAMVLFDAASRFSLPDYAKTAQRNLNFILQSQREDGAWLYAFDNPAETFIDHFHTCFVLKNLWKLNQRLRSSAVTASITRGYDYYRKNLFDAEDLPRSFAIKPRMQLGRYELYDFAEAITLGALLRQDIPDAFDLACRLASFVAGRFQLRDGHFLTRVYRGGIKHRFPYLRWSQAQMFYALTNLLVASQ
jgi:hypothetical protein